MDEKVCWRDPALGTCEVAGPAFGRDGARVVAIESSTEGEAVVPITRLPQRALRELEGD